MEHNFNNIDHLFKDGLSGYTETPPPDVWEALEKRLDDRKKRPGIAFRWPWFFVMLLIVGVFSSLMALNLSGNSIENLFGGSTNTIAGDRKTSPDATGNNTTTVTQHVNEPTITKSILHEQKRTYKRNHEIINTPTTLQNNTGVSGSAANAQPVTATGNNAESAKNSENNIAGTMGNATGENDRKTDAGVINTNTTKYVVKHKVKNNILVAEAEPVSSDNSYSISYASTENNDDEDEQVTFGKSVSSYTAGTKAQNTHTAVAGKPVTTANLSASIDKHDIHIKNEAAKKQTVVQENTGSATQAQHKAGKIDPTAVAASATVVNNKIQPTANKPTPKTDKPVQATGQTSKQQIAPALASVPKTAVPVHKNTAATPLAVRPATTNHTIAHSGSETATLVKKPATSHAAVSRKVDAKHVKAIGSDSKNNAVSQAVAAREKTTVTAPKKPGVAKSGLLTIAKGNHSASGKTSPVRRTTANIATPVAIKTEKKDRTIAGTVKSAQTHINKEIATSSVPKSHILAASVTAKREHRSKNNSLPVNKTAATATAGKQIVPAKPITHKGSAHSINTLASTHAVSKKEIKKSTKTGDAGVAETNRITRTAKNHIPKTKPAVSVHNNDDAIKTATANHEKKNNNKPVRHQVASKTKPTNTYAGCSPSHPLSILSSAFNTFAALPDIFASAPAKVQAQAQKIMSTFKGDSTASIAPKPDNKSIAATTDSNASKHKFLSGFDYGIKVGYEGAYTNKGSEKMVVSGYIGRNLTGKFSYMVQPAIKVAHANNKDIGSVHNFYDTTTADIKNSNYVVLIYNQDTFFRHNFNYSQKYDSIAKTYGIGGNYMELELPVLLKYRFTDKLSVYGGLNIGFSKSISIREHTSNTGFTTRVDSSFTINTLYAPSAAPATGSVMKYAGDYIGNYKGPAYPTPPGSSVRLGYMLGFSYEFRKRWLADVLVQQTMARSNVQGGYNTNTALSLPYFRLSVGYRLSK